jgi:hypothetical protein
MRRPLSQPQPEREYHTHGLRDLAKHANDSAVRWTLWREIYGTFIGVLPFLLVGLGAWMNMSERVRVAEVQITANKQSHDMEIANIKTTLEAASKQTERDRQELREQLANISRQIESLQKDIVGHARGR